MQIHALDRGLDGPSSSRVQTDFPTRNAAQAHRKATAHITPRRTSTRAGSPLTYFTAMRPGKPHRVFRQAFHLGLAILVSPGAVANAGVITIDDSEIGASLEYHGRSWSGSPAKFWCPGCGNDLLDPSRLFQGTCHFNMDTSGKDYIILTWTGMCARFVSLLDLTPAPGTSISVYFVVPYFGGGTASTFTLDGVPSAPFTSAGDSPTSFDYNVTAFHVEGLNNTQHTLLIQPQPHSRVLFDYATYT
jgi:hypothetical protein